MKKAAVIIFGLLHTTAMAQPVNVNPSPNDVWSYYGPTLGAGWGSPAVGMSILNMYSATNYGNCDWTSKATGVPNDISPCLQAAHDDVAARGGGTVVVPVGRYGMLANGITYSNGVYIVGAGGAIRNVCATRIEAISGFTGTMFYADHVAGIGLKSMCIDGLGRAAKVLDVRSVGMYDFDHLMLDDATDVVLQLDIGPTDIQPTNLSSFTNSFVRTNNANFPNADACRIGDSDLSLPNRTNDVNSTTFDNFTCISRDGWSIDLRGADSLLFTNFRFDSTGDGNAIFRAGLVSTPGSGNLMGWARYNTFIRGSIGGGGRSRLIVEGSDCRSEVTGSIAPASFSGTGSVSASTLTMATVDSGFVAIGAKVSGTDVVAGSMVTSQISGTPGGAGEYGLSEGRQSVASTTISGTYGTLTVTAQLSGDAPKVEDRVYGGTTLGQTRVTQDLGSNVYAVGKTQTVPSQTLVVGTCPDNLDPRPSRDNMIYAYGKGGGQPNPLLGANAELFCQANNIGGNCGNDMSPWLSYKSVPPVIIKDANYTIVARDCGSSLNTRTAGGATTITLPAAGDNGCRVEINKWANHNVTIDVQGSDTIRGPAGLTAAGDALLTGYGYSSITLEDQSNTGWVVKAHTGAWFNTTAGGLSPVGGWQHVATDQSTANNAALSFSFVPISAYAAAYRLNCQGLVPTTDGTNARVIVGTGSTPTYQADAFYQYAVSGETTSAADTTARSTNATQGFLINSTTGTDSDALGPMTFEFTLNNPKSTTAYKGAFWAATYENSSDLLTTSRGGGRYAENADPITALRFAYQSGNITTGGQCSASVLVP